MVRCRLATLADLENVSAIWHESASRMDGVPAKIPSASVLRTRIDDELASGWTLYVADEENIVVGMLAIDIKRAVLDQLFVTPSSQGQDVGRTLLHVAMHEMRNGFTLRVSSTNLQARMFYEKAGLKLLNEGSHPRTGAPVCFYSCSGMRTSEEPLA